MKHPCAALLPLLALSIYSAAPLPAVAAPGGLSSAQLNALRAIPFAVVPQSAPSGFHVRSVSVNRAAQAYTIEYAGPGGAVIRVSGAPTGSRVAAATPTPAPRGLFQKIFGGLGKHSNLTAPLHAPGAQANQNANSNTSTAGEEQEEMTAVSADSPLLGPVNFQNDRRCLRGANDPGKAQIRNAAFTVVGCSMREPDALIRAYRSLERVNR